MNTDTKVRVCKGEVWDCGEWGRIRVTGHSGGSGDRRYVLGKHMSGGTNNCKRGDEVALLQSKFVSYQRVR